ncbi:unnamed protein product [Cuscuta epithymum]|uniref:Uncharacterized protein n=1 Tax=Cuscuta epithymum TaxID=186058 RepID=A0AAV0EE38_9ASTE|nr:unnamed protein product [Cuscuta epithymum]CAH9122270.1 unnamed protein product [Cuscuta epithymum]
MRPSSATARHPSPYKHSYYELRRTLDHHIERPKNFRIDGHQGTVSFKTSKPEHLCAACNTLKLFQIADYKVCAFGPFEVKFLSSCTQNDFTCAPLFWAPHSGYQFTDFGFAVLRDLL